MKYKTLAAICLLGCFMTSSAYAGQIMLRGFLNYGVQVTKAKHSPTGVSMESDQPNGSRIILLGTEDLNADYKIGFNLVDRFKTDTGKLIQDNRQFLFTRLYIDTPIGAFGGGSFSAFGSEISPNAEWIYVDAFGGGYGDAGVQSVLDGMQGQIQRNSLYFMSKPFSGLRLGLMFSLTSTADDEGEKFSRDTHAYEVFLSYDQGPLTVKLDAITYQYGGDSTYTKMDAPWWIKAGVRYTLPCETKIFAGFGYGRNQVNYDTTAQTSGVRPVLDNHGRGIDSYSGHIGLNQPLGPGYIMAQYQAQFGKNHNAAVDGEKNSFSRHVFALGYNYHLSKRTDVYTVASYSLTTGVLKDTAVNRAIFMTGLAHTF